MIIQHAGNSKIYPGLKRSSGQGISQGNRIMAYANEAPGLSRQSTNQQDETNKKADLFHGSKVKCNFGFNRVILFEKINEFPQEKRIAYILSIQTQIYMDILLQAEEVSSGAMYGQFLLLGGIFLIFYLFMIRPQQKRQKEEKVFRENLSKGDKVMTIGGLHGRVESLDDTTALLSVDSNVKLRFEKSALRAIPEVGEK
jgi:preprotein translocase subunit YajC